MSKGSKLRACPALGKGISPADCGEQRNSRLACPADCIYNIYNPANYPQVIELSNKLEQKASGRLGAKDPDPGATIRKISRCEKESPFSTTAFLHWQLYFAQDGGQRTFLQRWEADHWADLKNDERVAMRGRMRMRVALLEIHQISAGGRMEAVDLLEENPRPITVIDQTMAARVSRFTTMFAWLFPLPHYWQTSGTGIPLPAITGLSAKEVAMEIITHLGGPTTEPEPRRWLAGHIVEIVQVGEAVLAARRRQVFENMDAKWGSAVYELRATFGDCRRRLDEAQDVEPDKLGDSERDEGFAEARVWFYEPKHADTVAAAPGEVVLGRILLGQTTWRLEAMGAERLSQLRSMFENHMAEHVRFTAERIDDLGARMAARTPAPKSELIPPRLMEHPPQMVMVSSRIPQPPGDLSPAQMDDWFAKEMDRAFLENPVPLLNQLTPRAAAKDPALRPRLVEIMKARIRSQDERNLETGGKADQNWMLEELGLTELIFDPPPWRPRPPNLTRSGPRDFEERDEFEDDDWLNSDVPFAPTEAGPPLSPAPPLPSQPLSATEAFERIQRAAKAFATLQDAEEDLAACGSTLIEDANDLTLDCLSGEEFDHVVPFLVRIWYALVPIGCQPPEINYDRWEQNFLAFQDDMIAASKGAKPANLSEILGHSSQPDLALVIAADFCGFAQDPALDVRLSLAAQGIMLALQLSLVQELDAILRPPPANFQ